MRGKSEECCVFNGFVGRLGDRKLTLIEELRN